MKNKLYCGAAKADITPMEEEISGLFGLMGISYAGIIDRLAVRIIALASGENRALIVAFDLDKAPNPAVWLSKLSVHTGIREESILWSGTAQHKVSTIDALLFFCRRTAAEEAGEPVQPHEGESGSWQRIQPDGTIVYNRI